MKRAFLYIFFSSETYSINLSSGRNVIHTRHSIDQSVKRVFRSMFVLKLRFEGLRRCPISSCDTIHVLIHEKWRIGGQDSPHQLVQL